MTNHRSAYNLMPRGDERYEELAYLTEPKRDQDEEVGYRILSHCGIRCAFVSLKSFWIPHQQCATLTMY